MGLLGGLFGLPLLPVRGTIAIAEVVLRQAEDEYYDPARIRAQLDEVDELRASGELSEEDAVALEEELIARLMVSRTVPHDQRGGT
ncbi:gas vesicle protein GvpG [Isoptericola cucumis]|uniref:Gas vesicle protein n=1 Tax=Isoptericola cucumis TaxID=1776856 RepID=A0ABQ2B395_9MICO|nr:gas vesicle protein GvpG [Isoptericola cucumis]GGI06748.1 gas vesicle protein [Isoptericola cucumis]